MEGEVAARVMELEVLGLMVKVEEVLQVVALRQVGVEVVALKQVAMERRDWLALMGEEEALQQVETGVKKDKTVE